MDMGRMLGLSREESQEENERETEYRKLPEGLISLLDSSELTDMAMESGFHVEMSSVKPGRDPSWVKFVMLAEGTARRRSYFGRKRDTTRVSYVESGTENTMELVPLTPDPMPRCIWVRVTELPAATLAGVIAEGMLSGPHSEQTTLDEFTDLGFEDQISRARELVLPGPDWDGCC
tara:strand:- start:398 stop:925 length:528 start_codon:yes stop_codon:yes gene_type:complete